MELYRKIFDISRKLIIDSRTNPDLDLFRVIDMYDAIGPNQLASKQWLVDEALPHINEKDIIMVAGAWYAVQSHLLRLAGVSNTLYNIDTDIGAKRIGKQICPTSVYLVEDAIDYYLDHNDWFSVLINTSSEHMEPDDFELMMRSKPATTLLICQSNNNRSEDEHINCHDSPEELAEACKLSDIYYTGSKTFKGKESSYERHMVIGR